MNPVRSVLLAALVVLLVPSIGRSSVVATFAPGGEGTRGSISGRAVVGSTVTVTFPDGTSASVKVTAAQGTFSIPVPAGMPNGKATVRSSADAETETPTIALLHPPDTSTQVASTLLANSFAGFSENTFALAGNFVSIDNFVDYNSGEVAGVVPASTFHISGAGTAGTLDFSLTSDLPYSSNFLPLWVIDDWPGVSISGSGAISGIATFNSIPISFSGSVTGNVTFLEGGVEDANLSVRSFI